MLIILSLLMHFSLGTDQIIKLIDQEIILLQNKKLSLNYQYRLFELYIEKIKRLRVLENAAFLKEIETNPESHRDLFFLQSQKLSQTTIELGEQLLSSNLDIKTKAQIYYALGLENIDKGQEKKAAELLDQAGSLAPENFEIQSARADALFNIKKYKEANQIYSNLSKDDKNPFKTKILHQYAWTNFKNGQFNKALDAIEEAFILNKEKNVVKNLEEVTTTLTNFYAVTNNGERGIQFFTKQNLEADFLLKAAKKFRINGLNKHTLQLYQIIKSKKLTLAQETALLNEEILNSIQNKDENNLFNSLNILLKNQIVINEDTKFEVENYLKENFTIKAKLITKSFESKESIYLCEQYIHFLTQIDNHQKCIYDSQLGDLYQVLNDQQKAIASYKSSFEHSLKGCAKDKRNDSLNMLLTMIEDRKLNDQELKDLKFYTYSNYIVHAEDVGKKQKVNLNYISLFIENKNFIEAYHQLQKYAQVYPNNQDARNLFKVIFDKFFEQNDFKSLFILVKDANHTNFSFNKADLSSIQQRWVDVQLKISSKFLAENKYQEALAILESIDLNILNAENQSNIFVNKAIIKFHTKDFLHSIKNIEMAYQINQNLYNSSFADKVAEIFQLIPLNYYDLASENVKSFILANCQENNPYKINLSNQYFYFLVNDHTKIGFSDEYLHCLPLSEKNKLITKELSFYLSLDSFDNAEKLVEKNSQNKEFIRLNSESLKMLMWNNEELISKWESFDNIKNILSADYSIYNNFQAWKKDVVNLNQFVKNLKLHDEKSWSRLNRALDDLAYFTTKSKKFLKTQHKILVTQTLREQMQALNNILTKINNHRAPSSEIEQFKSQINDALMSRIQVIQTDLNNITSSNMSEIK